MLNATAAMPSSSTMQIMYTQQLLALSLILFKASRILHAGAAVHHNGGKCVNIVHTGVKVKSRRNHVYSRINECNTFDTGGFR